MRHFDSGCCDAKRDARAMGYRNAREADEDNWGQPWPIEKPRCPKCLDTGVIMLNTDTPQCVACDHCLPPKGKTNA